MTSINSTATFRICAAILLSIMLGWFCHPFAVAAPLLEDAKGTNLTIAISRDQIRWGEETEITVTAVNSTGSTLPGGLYVSFDEDVLVLEVNGGTLLRPPDTVAYNLKTSTSRPITRPMVEAWQQDWKAGVERRVVVTVLPIARERVRVLARASFIEPGNQPRLHISPGRLESRSLDEADFPNNVGYVRISRYTSLRRAIRRVERRMRELDATEQSRFAFALAAALEDRKALNDLLQDASGPDLKQFSQGLPLIAPRIAEQLKRDPLIALDNLRCLMASLNCPGALFYFGVPIDINRKLNAEEAARLDAKQYISNEKGGTELIALLDAEGFAYRRESATGAVIVQLEGKSVKIERAPIVPELLEQIIAVLGSAAARPISDANGMSFTDLKSKLATAGPEANRPNK